jgi:hypothetical protein
MAEQGELLGIVLVIFDLLVVLVEIAMITMAVEAEVDLHSQQGMEIMAGMELILLVV